MLNWLCQSPTFSLVLTALWQTLKGAGIVDYFDVAAVTFLIYIALRWMRRGRAVGVLQGAVLITVLYGVARQTGLVLTTSLFRGLLTIVMLSLASLFQEDLRRFFERLTSYKTGPIHQRVFQALLRSVRHFSKQHIGALIVFKGRDPLDRHLDGGQTLDGRLSSALLESLFDPHSDGHDGAVIIDGNDIKRFGVHLPLSKHLGAETGLGTRHAAALGLAELTDAFCLVVSETRGSVMIAHEGRLVNMGNGRRLERRLDDFLRERFLPRPAERIWWRPFAAHPIEKGLSLALGLALWLIFVKGIRPVERVLTLPVEVTQVPKGLAVDTVVPSKAQVTLRGLQKDLLTLPADLAIRLEIPRITHPRQNLTLSSRHIHAPECVWIESITPGSVLLRLKAARLAPPHKPAPPRHAWFRFR